MREKASELEPFALERYFARHEFTAPFLLSPSDTEPLAMVDLLALADDDARSRWERMVLGYTESRGLPALRTAIASFVSEAFGVSRCVIGPEDVLVFSCAEEAIYCIVRAMVRPGDEVACTWPAYQSLFEVARAIGATVRPIPLVMVRGCWDLDPEAIQEAITGRTRLVVTNVPHNPTGMVPSPGSWSLLLDRLAETGSWHLADEVYRPLAHPGVTLPPSPVLDQPRTISLGSVSKAFGLAGVRIGWAACKDPEILGRLEQYKDYTTICASAPSEILALAALRAWRVIVAGQQAIIDANAPALESLAASFPDLVDVPMPSGGSTAFPLWRGPGDAEAMADRAVNEAGVMVLPGSVFDPRLVGSKDLHLERRFRIGLGRRDFPQVAARLGAHLSRTYQTRQG